MLWRGSWLLEGRPLGSLRHCCCSPATEGPSVAGRSPRSLPARGAFESWSARSLLSAVSPVSLTPSSRVHAPGSPPLVQFWLRVSRFPTSCSLLLRNWAGQLPGRKGVCSLCWAVNCVESNIPGTGPQMWPHSPTRWTLAFLRWLLLQQRLLCAPVLRVAANSCPSQSGDHGLHKARGGRGVALTLARGVGTHACQGFFTWDRPCAIAVSKVLLAHSHPH